MQRPSPATLTTRSPVSIAGPAAALRGRRQRSSGSEGMAATPAMGSIAQGPQSIPSWEVRFHTPESLSGAPCQVKQRHVREQRPPRLLLLLLRPLLAQQRGGERGKACWPPLPRCRTQQLKPRCNCRWTEGRRVGKGSNGSSGGGGGAVAVPLRTCYIIRAADAAASCLFLKHGARRQRGEARRAPHRQQEAPNQAGAISNQSWFACKRDESQMGRRWRSALAAPWHTRPMASPGRCWQPRTSSDRHCDTHQGCRTLQADCPARGALLPVPWALPALGTARQHGQRGLQCSRDGAQQPAEPRRCGGGGAPAPTLVAAPPPAGRCTPSHQGPRQAQGPGATRCGSTRS